MTEAEWLACSDAKAMLEFLRSKTSDRKLRLFAVACCRRIWRHFEEDCKRFVGIAERYADNEVNRQALDQCRDEAFTLMCEMVSNSAAAPWLATVERPMPAGPNGFRAPATIYEAAIEAAKAAVSAVREDYFVFHTIPEGENYLSMRAKVEAEALGEQERQADFVRCIFGAIPFRISFLKSEWLTWSDAAVRRIAEGIYEERRLPEGTLDGGRLAILSDALRDAGCDNAELIAHCRSPGPHVRGCWALDLLTGRG